MELTFATVYIPQQRRHAAIGAALQRMGTELSGDASSGTSQQRCTKRPRNVSLEKVPLLLLLLLLDDCRCWWMTVAAAG